MRRQILKIKFRPNGESAEKYLLYVVSKLLERLPPSARKKLENAVWRFDNDEKVLECILSLSLPLRIASFWRALFDGACKNIEGYVTCEIEEARGLEPFLGISTKNVLVKTPALAR